MITAAHSWTREGHTGAGLKHRLQLKISGVLLSSADGITHCTITAADNAIIIWAGLLMNGGTSVANIPYIRRATSDRKACQLFIAIQ